MRAFELGAWSSLSGRPGGNLQLPAHHLLTHSVAVGMTGSGKTGLLFVLVEEALRSGVPVLMIDLKGDLPNLALSFATPGPEPFLPWAASMLSPNDPRTVAQLAADLAEARQRGFDSWGIHHEHVRQYNDSTQIRVLTPGSSAGELVHLLSALERPSLRWHEDKQAAQQSLSAAISLLLNLVGRDADPVRSREHVLRTRQPNLLAKNATGIPVLDRDAAEGLVRCGAGTVILCGRATEWHRDGTQPLLQRTMSSALAEIHPSAYEIYLLLWLSVAAPHARRFPLFRTEAPS